MTIRLRAHRFILITAFCLLIASIGTIDAQTSPFAPDGPRPAPLDAADRALLDGDYQTALSQYNGALGTPDLACDALIGAGISYSRLEMDNEAAAAFTQHIDGCGATFKAHVLRGAARQNLGDSAGAQSDYETALTLGPGLVDSYLYERIAAVNPDASVLYLRLAAEVGREPQGEYVLRNELAQIYRIIGRLDEALIQYDAITGEALLSDEQENDQAAIALAAANIEIALGNDAGGYERMQRIISDFPETPAAFDALVDLVTAGQPVDPLTRMRINVLNQNYRPVVSVLEEGLDGTTPELYLLLGRSQRGLDDDAAALTTFQLLRDTFPSNPLASMAALEQADTYADANDTANAIAAYVDVASAYPASPEAPLALLRAARLANAAGDPTQAVSLYDQLGLSYPESEQARDGLFEAARMFQAAGDAQRAAEFYGRSGSSHGLVWQGKILQAIGDPAGATAAWEAGVNADPGTFFSMRACALINGTPAYESSTNLRFADRTPDDINNAAAWVAQTFGLGAASVDLSPELAEHPLFKRGNELWALGWQREATAEFVALHRLYRDNPLAMFQLAHYYRTIHAYRPSIVAATRLIYLAQQPLPAIAPYVAHMAYPLYYADLIQSAAQQYQLDPLYVASLTRQESTYEADAISIAGARGLMQLMPATAADVASRLGLGDYDVDDLTRPTVNIALGTFYVASARDYLDGSVVGALLGYNAGPGRAAEWLQQSSGDIDLLYETIPFDETRLYLDITYENFAAYRYLYGDGMPDCMFTVAPPPPPEATPSP
ncbi:MAG: tetratricopeptide repeat protein [Anaerolineae bacterium]|nr:tetratricopeptide repeat protein [Anaerolineae bacterium]